MLVTHQHLRNKSEMDSQPINKNDHIVYLKVKEIGIKPSGG